MSSDATGRFDHNLPCARSEGSLFCASDAVREDFAEIAAVVAGFLRRSGHNVLPQGRLALDAGTPRPIADPVFELQFERCLDLLVRVSHCADHPVDGQTGDRAAWRRLRTATVKYLLGSPAHRATLRKDVIVALHWATRDYGRYALAGTVYTSRPERKFCALTDSSTGLALLSPAQVAVATLLVRGVVAFGEQAAARIVLGMDEEPVALAYIRRVTVSAYRSPVADASPLLLELGDAELARELSTLRHWALWRRGGAAAIGLFRALLTDAGQLVVASLDQRRADSGGDVVAASVFDDSREEEARAELAALRGVRDRGYRLPDGRRLTPAQRRIVDARLAESYEQPR